METGNVPTENENTTKPYVYCTRWRTINFAFILFQLILSLLVAAGVDGLNFCLSLLPQGIKFTNLIPNMR